MEFKEIQDAIIKVAETYGRKFKIKIDENFALLKLYEEVGEFAQSILIHRKECKPKKYLTKNKSRELIAHELADILGLVIINAHLLGIDLQKAIEEKWLIKADISL
jgi:NTP pyrophosphatase (non-canonical NTP hydrolase)